MPFKPSYEDLALRDGIASLPEMENIQLELPLPARPMRKIGSKPGGGPLSQVTKPNCRPDRSVAIVGSSLLYLKTVKLHPGTISSPLWKTPDTTPLHPLA